MESLMDDAMASTMASSMDDAIHTRHGSDDAIASAMDDAMDTLHG